MCTEEVCDDQQDEDLDGLIDCADPDCAIATVCQQECVDMSTNDLGSVMGMSVAMGSNIGMLDDSQGECTMGTSGEDVTYWWEAQLMLPIHSKPQTQLRHCSLYTRNLYDGTMGV